MEQLTFPQERNVTSLLTHLIIFNYVENKLFQYCSSSGSNKSSGEPSVGGEMQRGAMLLSQSARQHPWENIGDPLLGV